MRKQEIVHLHGLFLEIRRFLVDHEEVVLPDGAFDRYDALEIAPSAINRRKGAHEVAVEQLLEGLEEVARPREPQPSR